MHSPASPTRRPPRASSIAGWLLVVVLAGACGEPSIELPVVVAHAWSVEEDVELAGELASDGGNDEPPVYAVAEDVSHGLLELDAGTGAFTYRPDPDFFGTDTFRVTATRGHLTSEAAQLRIEVLPVNDAPSTLPGALRTAEDAPEQTTLEAGDAEGEAVSFVLVDGPKHGVLELTADTGLVRYVPEPDWHGTDEATFRASDGKALSAPTTLLLTVDAVNDPPLATPAEVELAEDGLAAGLVVATDVDSFVVTYRVTTWPSHGTLDLDGASGAYTYSPEPDFNGQDAFSFVASDEEATSAPATVSLSVTPVNDAPVLVATSARGEEDGVLTASVSGRDPEGDALTFEMTVPPAHGSASLDPATGSLTYTPDADWSGSDVVTLTASDGRLTSAPAPFALEVTAVNDAPVASAGAVTFREDEEGAGQLVATDVDGPVESYAVIAPPARGVVRLDAATGAYTYTPEQDFHGSDSFSFVASDGQAVSGAARIDVEVTPQNDAPVLPALADVVHDPGAPAEAIVQLPERDQDGDLLTYRVTASRPSAIALRVLPSAQLGLTPIASGATVVTVFASDGLGDGQASFTFTALEGVDTMTFVSAVPHERAVSIVNTSEVDVELALRQNGSALVTSADQLVDEALALPDAPAETGLAGKLWRFVRDETYHGDPLVAAVWQHDPVLMMNSIGFGFCDDAAAVYAAIARAGGEEARAWFLEGHIVPEIRVNSRWSLYDPDLGVYYEDSDGTVAGVEEVAADPTLITLPRRRVSPAELPYSDFVAELYATQDNNFVIPEWFYAPPRERNEVRLPGGARLEYPGIWADLPVGYWGSLITATAQMKLDLPPGFAGAVDLPLVLWDVQGTGRVRIGAREYEAGSPEVRALLRDLEHGHPAQNGVEVLSSTSMLLVYLMNPMRFMLEPSVTLEVTSTRPAAIAVRQFEQAPEHRLPLASVDGVARPR